ncbi:MAG: PpiC-type peptidyl-prolyl cis-trans isomerase [Ramlibacter sp.]|jgi:peptidyl-prolyl cis-trans isomerase D|nr:PpiC-type peptidyl-prolyl cis-trans isomerase [Ramlibacter sp.]
MFDFVRKHTKVMQFVLFLLIVPSFVLFGLEGYNRYKDQGEPVARVDGHDILQGEWDNAHKAEIERIRQGMPTLDAKLLDSPEARYASLERLVHDRVLSAASVQSKLVTSDAQLARELHKNQAIASLRGPDGKLDMERYRQLVGAQGMTPEMFENGVRAELSTRQVLAGVGGTSFAPPAVASAALNAFFEKREVQVAMFAAPAFAAKVNPTDAELESYYKQNAGSFQAPEEASIEYLVLDLDSVMKGITVSESDLKTYYEQNAQRLGGQEERRASHILIAVPKTASAADREKAKATAESLLAAVKKAPDSFADVARKNSQDPGSAANGGDLDFFARGAMTKPFEDVAFSLKKGEISNLVETEFGYHIIRVTDIKSPKQKTFEEMKPELETELKKQQAQRKYAESADAFSNGVYEQADSLKPVADKLKLEIRTANNVSRVPAPGAKGPLASLKFLGAVFSPDAVEKKRNTEAIETGPNQLVSGRIAKYTPARTLPFAEVKDRVRDRYVASRAAELAHAEGMAKLAAWKAQPAAAELPLTATVSRQEAQKHPPGLVEAALRADPAALPAFVGVDLGQQGYAVVKVTKVLPREASNADAAKQELQQYARAWGSAENVAYYNLLKERFKTQVKVAKPAARTESSPTQ